MIVNCIIIDEVWVENGCFRLMKNFIWEYDVFFYVLIVGGIGGGKIYFLLMFIEVLLYINVVFYILDLKNVDFVDLGIVMGNVYYIKEEMIDCVNFFYEGMV